MRTHARQPTPAGDFSTIEARIHVVRGERVILDADLAGLYGVPTKVLNQAVRRNIDKFPGDFLLQLTPNEALTIRRSQIVTASSQRFANKSVTKHAFTEHGALMAANVLNSPRAVQMSVFIVRAFIRMRSAMTDTRELARKLADLEKDLTSRLDSHETAITEFMRRLMQLLDPPPAPEPPSKELGFHTSMGATRNEPMKGPEPK